VTRKEEIWNELFSRNHPCLRASLLPKRFGWGVHFNSDGKIALYGKESHQYDHFTTQGEENAVKLLPAMRNKRASKGED
jgi:hypothetical protein